MSAEIEFEKAVGELRELIASGGHSLTGVAVQLELTHTALARILDGTTKNPHARTRKAIIRLVKEIGRHGPPPPNPDAGEPTPEEVLLQFFMENHSEMAVFMSTTTEGLSAEDRRKVALAILNGFKKLAIQAGEPIPDILYQIERRFVAESD